MRYTLRAPKRDKSEPEIVKGLEESGWTVHRELPVDLVCLKWVTLEQLKRLLVQRSDGLYRAVILLEAKTRQKNGKIPVRKNQQEQNQFCLDWRIDKPTSAFEAKLMAGETLEL